MSQAGRRFLSVEFLAEAVWASTFFLLVYISLQLAMLNLILAAAGTASLGFLLCPGRAGFLFGGTFSNGSCERTAPSARGNASPSSAEPLSILRV